MAPRFAMIMILYVAVFLDSFFFLVLYFLAITSQESLGFKTADGEKKPKNEREKHFLLRNQI